MTRNMNFQQFKQKYQREDVVEYANRVSKKPLVSVCVQTYQHKLYIKECLEGILMQKVDFSFEILLGEDDSTDGTREICLEYAKRYPDKIRLFLHHRDNNIKVNGRPTGRFNFVYNLFSAKGNYIALCPGDDYWIDPLKLKKQIEVLENRPQIIVCHHWHKYRVGCGEEIEAPKENQGYLPNEIATVNQIFLNKLRIKSRTMVFRNILGSDFFPDWFYYVAFGDVPFNFLLGKYGKFYFIDEPMAVYRQTGKGVSSAGKEKLPPPKFTELHYKSWIEIWDYANIHYNYEFEEESIKTINEFYSLIFKKNLYSVSAFLNLLFHSLFGRAGSILRRLPSTIFLLRTLVNKKLNFRVFSKVKTFIFR